MKGEQTLQNLPLKGEPVLLHLYVYVCVRLLSYAPILLISDKVVEKLKLVHTHSTTALNQNGNDTGFFSPFFWSTFIVCPSEKPTGQLRSSKGTRLF